MNRPLNCLLEGLGECSWGFPEAPALDSFVRDNMKITLKDLTKKFPGRSRRESGVTAVDCLNFEIQDGELISLLGPSGCGKSTTLMMICGLLTPSDGQIFFDEEDVTALPPEERGVGVVFQNYALYPHMTVLKNITFPMGNLKGKDRLSREEMNARAMEAARLVQIEALLDRRPAELSGGQQQRVAIARALVKKPRVLLMDEPLSNLDARLRLQTREEIRRIQKETGVTTIFVTHDQEEAMSISDRIVVMKAGLMQQAGKPQDVYDDPVNLFVAKFLGTPPVNVFSGEIRSGQLYLDGDDSPIFPLDCDDRKVWAAIRPEGFALDPEGPLKLALRGIEVMGRDISVLSGHPAFTGETIRSIIPSVENWRGIDSAGGSVRFSLHPGKTYCFDRESEERII